jgi:hypothetical protein
MKHSHISEAELVGCLTAWLVASGYRVKHEVANMGQSVDVVAVKGRWVTVFEAKRADWRRALRQCEAHEVVADFVCLAVGSVGIKEGLRMEVEKRGYGLVHFSPANQELQWICKPQRNDKVWSPQRRVWLSDSRKVRYAD